MRAGRESMIVAGEPTPFSKMVGYVEGWGRGGGVFIVDKSNVLDRGFGGLDVCVLLGLKDHIAAEEVAMAENELVEFC